MAVRARAAPKPGAHRGPRWSVGAAVLVGVVILAAGGYLVWGATTGGLPTTVPSCSWPLRADGPATAERVGLVRCYLRALASYDAGGLVAVAYTTGTPVRITNADFKHSSDARSGTATATFVQGEMDDTFAVTIVFADHARETLAMALANPGSAHSWRLGIGKAVATTSGPPPAKPSPG
jgi:hypothetical protein